MARQSIAYALPAPYPSPASAPGPSPLQDTINSTLQSTDYDSVCLPLTNRLWQARWDRLCLRPVEEESTDPKKSMDSEVEREKIDREADIWRKEGGLRRDELNMSRLEETGQMIGMAAEWLELDSEDEGIRFDSELVY
jgi:type II protein arginine methyltransferase